MAIRTLLSRPLAAARALLGAFVLLGAVAGPASGQSATPTSPAGPAAASGPGFALQLTLDGPIGPPAADYVRRGLDQARQDGAAVVVLRVDTPGGLDTSMREIIRAILASPVPVLGFVSPSGARAASAGTYILYASHVSAMSPGTNLGAATPVALGGGGGDGDGEDRPLMPRRSRGASDPASASGGDDAGRKPAHASEAKSLNDAIAYIRSLAALHGRNADWAEQAVRQAASLSAQDAARQNVIDLVAEDVPDLLDKAHGRTVRMTAGAPAAGPGPGGASAVPLPAAARQITLDTRGLTVQPLEPDLRTRLLSVLANPNLALLLMTVGIYGLLFEFMNPGALYPGIVGAICLLLGMYALSTLPLNYAGVALLVLGLGLMVAEAFTPSLGALGIGGALAFLLGAGMLIDESAPGFALSMPLAAGLAAAALGFGLLVARMAVRSQALAQRTGAGGMVGGTAQVQDWAGDRGHVFMHGERWNAQGPLGLQTGQQVRVTAVEGLTVTVAAGPVPPPGPAAMPNPPASV